MAIQTGPAKFSAAHWRRHARKLKLESRNSIDGNFVAAKGSKLETVSPATAEIIATVARSKALDVNVAEKAAHNAFRSGAWSRTEPRGRMEVLYCYGNLINQHIVECSLLDVLDMGKPIPSWQTWTCAAARGLRRPTIGCARRRRAWVWRWRVIGELGTRLLPAR